MNNISFSDLNITCVDCERTFVFSAGEQAFFLNKGHSLLRDMSDDELAQVITGDTKTKASDITDEQLKAILNGRGGNETGTPIAKLGT
jgi:Probable zinc-ribbon domain